MYAFVITQNAVQRIAISELLGPWFSCEIGLLLCFSASVWVFSRLYGFLPPSNSHYKECARVCVFGGGAEWGAPDVFSPYTKCSQCRLRIQDPDRYKVVTKGEIMSNHEHAHKTKELLTSLSAK